MMSPVVRMSRPFTLERMDRVFPVTGEALGTCEKILVAVRVEGAQRRRAGNRMARIRVTVSELDQMLWALHQGVVDHLSHEHGAHRDDARSNALGDGHEVRRHAEEIGFEGRPEPAEAGDDLVEDQKDALPVADRPDPFQTSPRRDKHSRRPGRLDDHRGDRRAVV
jgi:hypothetical protein